MSIYEILLIAVLIALLVLVLRSLIFKVRNRDNAIHMLPEEFQNLPFPQRQQQADYIFRYASPRNLIGIVIAVILLISLRWAFPEQYAVLCNIFLTC